MSTCSFSEFVVVLSKRARGFCRPDQIKGAEAGLVAEALATWESEAGGSRVQAFSELP